MAEFRAYSEKYPFRQRSETPSMAKELSLQCWRRFGMDGVIFFSDILTPLPAIGIDFDVVRGRGPVVPGDLGEALAGCVDVLSVDWHMRLSEAARMVQGTGLVLQGNLDPHILVH